MKELLLSLLVWRSIPCSSADPEGVRVPGAKVSGAHSQI